MYSLFLDTSTKYLCIGIAKDNKIIYKYQQEAIKKQSELTIPYLSKCLDLNNLTPNDINEIVVTIGPGSFTGIRIGLTIAKVLASIRKIPLKAISSLNAYASVGKKIVLLDARSNRSYVGIYDNNKPMIQECVLELKDVLELIKKYPDYDVVLDAFLVGKTSEDIDVIDNMNRISMQVEPVKNVDTLVPIYLKDR